MTDDLPNALEMLKLEPDEFMRKVSLVVSKKPWPHNIFECGVVASHIECSKCHTVFSGAEASHATPRDILWAPGHLSTIWELPGCPVPPALTEPVEVWAFRLRDQVEAQGKSDPAEVAMVIVRAGSVARFHTGAEANTERFLRWWVRKATPEQQIAVCLVALGHWRI